MLTHDPIAVVTKVQSGPAKLGVSELQSGLRSSEQEDSELSGGFLLLLPHPTPGLPNLAQGRRATVQPLTGQPEEQRPKATSAQKEWSGKRSRDQPTREKSGT